MFLVLPLCTSNSICLCNGGNLNSLHQTLQFYFYTWTQSPSLLEQSPPHPFSEPRLAPNCSPDHHNHLPELDLHQHSHPPLMSPSQIQQQSATSKDSPPAQPYREGAFLRFHHWPPYTRISHFMRLSFHENSNSGCHPDSLTKYF